MLGILLTKAFLVHPSRLPVGLQGKRESARLELMGRGAGILTVAR